MDKVELKRSNPIYIEIENFKDYEFTNNIAYEMAIRNLKVAALGFGLDLVFLKEKRERKYNPEFFKDDKIYMSIEELNIRYMLRNEFYITWLHYDLDQEYSKHYHFSDVLGFEMNFDENGKYEGATVIAADSCTALDLIPAFSRPIMLPPPEKDKRLPHFLNLGLPLKELEAYIRAVKKKFDKNHKHITTLAELLGAEADAADDSVQVGARAHHAKSVLSYKNKVADMFFVYDADRHDMSMQQIRNELNSYYESQGIYKTLADNSRYKYMDIAREYIDNLKYKELVSGVSW